MSDFHRTSPKMAWLRLCRITNESTETEKCYLSLNTELRWLWNSVYYKFYQNSLGFRENAIKVKKEKSAMTRIWYNENLNPALKT